MAMPSDRDLMTLREVSVVKNVSMLQLKRAVYKGIPPRSGGARVFLTTWKTIRGVCTTYEAIDAFNQELNGEPPTALND
jgi:hypothetical protein